MKVLAISGWKRSGKDELCTRLTGVGAVRVSFADPLKDRVAEEYGIPRADLDDQSKKESPILSLPVEPKDAFTRTVTHLLVREFRTVDGKVCSAFDDINNMGMELRGEKNPLGVPVPTYNKLYWTPRALAIFKGSGNRAVASNYWVQQAIAKVNSAKSDLIVIPDLRFKSEVSQLREAFGDKLTTVRINRFETSPSTDASERDLDDGTFDYVIENKGTLEEFYAKIDSLMRVEFGIYG